MFPAVVAIPSRFVVHSTKVSGMECTWFGAKFDVDESLGFIQEDLKLLGDNDGIVKIINSAITLPLERSYDDDNPQEANEYGMAYDSPIILETVQQLTYHRSAPVVVDQVVLRKVFAAYVTGLKIENFECTVNNLRGSPKLAISMQIVFKDKEFVKEFFRTFVEHYHARIYEQATIIQWAGAYNGPNLQKLYEIEYGLDVDAINERRRTMFEVSEVLDNCQMLHRLKQFKVESKKLLLTQRANFSVSQAIDDLIDLRSKCAPVMSRNSIFKAVDVNAISRYVVTEITSHLKLQFIHDLRPTQTQVPTNYALLNVAYIPNHQVWMHDLLDIYTLNKSAYPHLFSCLDTWMSQLVDNMKSTMAYPSCAPCDWRGVVSNSPTLVPLIKSFLNNYQNAYVGFEKDLIVQPDYMNYEVYTSVVQTFPHLNLKTADDFTIRSVLEFEVLLENNLMASQPPRPVVVTHPKQRRKIFTFGFTAPLAAADVQNESGQVVNS